MNELIRKKEFKIDLKDLKKIRNNFFSESLSEEETKSVIREIYKNYKLLVDPHTAVAIGATKKIALEGKTLILSTAHPSKFSDVVLKETGINPELPNKLNSILSKEEKCEKLPNKIEDIKNYILERV